MLPVSQNTLRASFTNATRREINELSLPPVFAELDWAALDYLGWRDAKHPRRAYVLVPVPDAVEPIGIVLRQAEAVPRARAQCSWCQDVRLPNPVVFYNARRSGAAGRNGDSVGTLVCADFECSANVRKLPPVAYLGFDVNAARDERIAALHIRAVGFTSSVMHGA